MGGVLRGFCAFLVSGAGISLLGVESGEVRGSEGGRSREGTTLVLLSG